MFFNSNDITKEMQDVCSEAKEAFETLKPILDKNPNLFYLDYSPVAGYYLGFHVNVLTHLPSLQD